MDVVRTWVFVADMDAHVLWSVGVNMYVNVVWIWGLVYILM
jgi:hypothetical protein